jgi:hypothetical protein
VGSEWETCFLFHPSHYRLVLCMGHDALEPSFSRFGHPVPCHIDHLSHISIGGAQISFLENSASSAYYPVLNSRQRIYPFVWWGPENQIRDLRKELGVRQNLLSLFLIMRLRPRRKVLYLPRPRTRIYLCKLLCQTYLISYVTLTFETILFCPAGISGGADFIDVSIMRSAPPMP